MIEFLVLQGYKRYHCNIKINFHSKESLDEERAVKLVFINFRSEYS